MAFARILTDIRDVEYILYENELGKEVNGMNKENVAFSVQMTPGEVFKFTIYHSYHKLSGIVGVCLSLLALLLLVTSFSELTDQNKTVLTIVALWFTILEPLTLFGRARTQVRKNKAYQKPLHYQMNQDGITVSQDEEQQTIPWNNLMKIVETKSQYLVYSSKIHAFVFPKKALGDECRTVEDIMVYYTKDTTVKLIGRIKNK